MGKETIFDYNVTPQEIKLLYVEHNTKELYIKNTSAKKILHDLYVLFRMREDYLRAGTIRKKLFGNAA